MVTAHKIFNSVYNLNVTSVNGYTNHCNSEKLEISALMQILKWNTYCTKIVVFFDHQDWMNQIVVLGLE